MCFFLLLFCFFGNKRFWNKCRMVYNVSEHRETVERRYRHCAERMLQPEYECNISECGCSDWAHWKCVVRARSFSFTYFYPFHALWAAADGGGAACLCNWNRLQLHWTHTHTHFVCLIWRCGEFVHYISAEKRLRECVFVLFFLLLDWRCCMRYRNHIFSTTIILAEPVNERHNPLNAMST